MFIASVEQLVLLFMSWCHLRKPFTIYLICHLNVKLDVWVFFGDWFITQSFFKQRCFTAFHRVYLFFFWHFIVTSCILWLWLFHRRNNHLCVYNGYVVLWTSVSCFFLSAACGERRFTSYCPLGGSFWFLHGNKAFRSVYPTWGWGDKTDDLWGCIDKNPLHYTTVCHCASSRSTEILNISSPSESDETTWK